MDPFENPENGYVRAPAPWHLTGDAYILAIKPSAGFVRSDCFVHAFLADRYCGGFGVVMFVNYRSSDVGPYQELLIMPGRFNIAGKRVYSVTKIYVSTWESVVNGRENWGIPKEKAEFDIENAGAGVERIRARQGDHGFADFVFKSYSMQVPFSSRLIPAAWRTLGQVDDNRVYLTRMEAKGRVRPARLIRSRIDGRFFPDFSPAHPIAAIRFENFQMTFHKSRHLLL